MDCFDAMKDTPIALIGLLWAAVAWIIYYVLSQVVQARRHAALAREWGCKEPVVEVPKLILGIDNLQRMLKADKNKTFPTDAIERTKILGTNTYKMNILGSHKIFTAEPKNVQALLATQFSDFDLGVNRRNAFNPLLGNGIFTQDGKAWEHSRAMMRPQFSRDQVSDLDLEERHIENFMRAVPAGSDGWTSQVDLSVLFFRLTLDSACEFLFGESVDTQLATLPTPSNPNPSVDDESVFARAFDSSQMTLAVRIRLGWANALYNPSSFKQACKDCHEFIDHFVRLALSKNLREKAMETGDNFKKEKYVFLEALAQQTRDPIELRSQLLHILLAGRDTTASLLGWLFYCLARDPERFNKLRQVVVDEFGSYESSGPNNITFSKLKSCTYLQQSLNEALRLYPVVAMNFRMANKDTTLPVGGGPDGQSKIFIPKGMEVAYSVFVMQRRTDLWGPDAGEYKPERWEGRRPGWEFVPFNGGPRICIGQQFALTEASYVVVRLLQRFDRMENLETDPVERHNMTLTNCSGNGVRVKLHAAS